MKAKKKTATAQKHRSKRGVGNKIPPSSQPHPKVLNELNEKHGVENITVKSDGTVELDVSKDTMDKIMNTDKPILKKASDITEADNLKFELGRLRTFLTVFKQYVEFEGNLYLVQVDPLNRMVTFLGGNENKQ